ncbi:hypothetical protein SUGI_0724890 [Cryptomeria japonica]|nr:hypothetical protein SUGI_0724890 [Cryptomeria japonica]
MNERTSLRLRRQWRVLMEILVKEVLLHLTQALTGTCGSGFRSCKDSNQARTIVIRQELKGGGSQREASSYPSFHICTGGWVTSSTKLLKDGIHCKSSIYQGT